MCEDCDLLNLRIKLEHTDNMIRYIEDLGIGVISIPEEKVYDMMIDAMRKDYKDPVVQENLRRLPEDVREQLLAIYNDPIPHLKRANCVIL